jgi:predicted NBD/HSP70 family sugar kinase
MEGAVYAGTTALRLGDYNQQVVLEVIRTGAGVSRTGIAERTGLTAQAISKIVRRLVEQGLVEETASTVPSRLGGRPAAGLRVNPAAGYAVGVHIDRDETAYMLLDLSGAVVARQRRATPAAGAVRTVRQIGTAVPALLERARVSPARVLGIGIGAPGPLDPDDGVVDSPGGMPGWNDVPLRDLVSERTGYPVSIENDAVAAAIGESWIGPAGRAHNLLFVYLGWGVGAALLIDGQPHRGSRAGSDLYHVPVHPEGPACGCGNHGCVGMYVSPTRVVESVRDLRRGGTDLDVTDYAGVCAAARAGAAVERRVLATAARMLGLGLVGTTNILMPEVVVIGGSAVEAARFVYEPEIRKALARRTSHSRERSIRVEFSAAGSDVGAVGAASIVLHAAFTPRIPAAQRPDPSTSAAGHRRVTNDRG